MIGGMSSERLSGDTLPLFFAIDFNRFDNDLHCFQLVNCDINFKSSSNRFDICPVAGTKLLSLR